MAQKPEVVLRKAVAQIRAGKREKARAALVDLLRREPNNEQAWYLLSFVLDDPQRQQYSLSQALRISPEFEKARARLGKLSGEVGEVTEPIAPFPPPIAEPETTKPAFFGETVAVDRQAFLEPESESIEEPPKPRRQIKIMPVILGVLVIGLLVLAVWVFLPGAATPQPTSTPIASQTLPATWTPTVEPSLTASSTPLPTSTPTPEPTIALSPEVSPSP